MPLQCGNVLIGYEFAAAQAAQKEHADKFKRGTVFAAAQAAQKQSTTTTTNNDTFAAAQAAQKTKNQPVI